MKKTSRRKLLLKRSLYYIKFNKGWQMEKLFWSQGAESIRLLDGEEFSLGHNPAGIIVYDEDGKIVGLQSYDNAIFYPANIIKDVLVAEGQAWSSLDEFQRDCCFDFDNEFSGWDNTTCTKEI